jgi:hypothetical protein
MQFSREAAAHRKAKLPAAVVDPSAQANDVDQNFAWPGIVWCRVVLGLDLPSSGHQVRIKSMSTFESEKRLRVDS